MPFDYSTVDLEAILQRSYNSMREIQRRGVGRIRGSRRGIINARMGIGKTFMALTIGFCFKPQYILIIGSKNSLAGWFRQIALWFPEFSDPSLYQIVRGQPHERQRAYQTPALFYVTTAASFNNDAAWLLTRKIKFDCIFIDEPQEYGYRNRKSIIFERTKKIIQRLEKLWGPNYIKVICAISGTWTSKGPPQQWALLHLLKPKIFASFWKFVNMFCITVKGPFGVEIGGPQNTESLTLLTAPYVFTVTDEEANEVLPPLNRQRIEIDLPYKYRASYKTMMEELYWELEGSVETATTILAAYTKLRQFINCPPAISDSWGQDDLFALDACIEKMQESRELPNWKHNIVFTPFIPAILPFQQRLSELLEIPPAKILIAKGGMEIEELRDLEERFRNEPDTLIVASLLYSQAWNAETVLNMYFPHFDWDQQKNQQAEGRGRRTDGVQKSIGSYYVNAANTVTDHMFDVLNNKTHINQVTYQDVKRLKELMKQHMANLSA